MPIALLRVAAADQKRGLKDAIREAQSFVRGRSFWRGTEAAEWGLPLPEDIVYSIIDTYLSRDIEMLKSLSLSCKALALYCQKTLLRVITVSTVRYERNRSPFKRFASVIEEDARILELAQELKLLDKHFVVLPGDGPKHMTKSQVALQTILKQPWKSLRRLHLSMQGGWEKIPKPLQRAIVQALKLPSLREVALSGVEVPLHLLGHCQGLETLEVRGDAKLSIRQSTLSKTFIIAPRHLTLQRTDPAHLKQLFSEPSSLRSHNLTNFTFGAQRSMVQDVIQALPPMTLRSISSLTILLTHPISDQGPCLLSLKGFSRLDSIGISEELFGKNPAALDWVFQILSSLRPSTRLRRIELSFRYDDMQHIFDCDWTQIDKLFHRRWPRLEEVRVVGYARYPLEMDWYRIHNFGKRLSAKLPSLRSGVLRTAVKNAYDLWK